MEKQVMLKVIGETSPPQQSVLKQAQLSSWYQSQSYAHCDEVVGTQMS
jgi:hypothetical protein